jgi:hypothetical protein
MTSRPHSGQTPIIRRVRGLRSTLAERPRCLDLLVAAVLAWFGGDEHYVETLHVPAIMVLGERALHLFGGGFRFFLR